MRHQGRGTLFYPDGRVFGEVEYVIDEQPKTAAALGRVSGRIQPVGPPTHFPFWDIMESPERYGALRLADGRWWLCNLQPDGEASNRHGGIQPPGPQPKLP